LGAGAVFRATGAFARVRGANPLLIAPGLNGRRPLPYGAYGNSRLYRTGPVRSPIVDIDDRIDSIGYRGNRLPVVPPVLPPYGLGRGRRGPRGPRGPNVLPDVITP